MWVGEQFYTMASFIDEANRMGISKRIHAFPDELEIGDRIYLAYKKCFRTEIPPEEQRKGRGRKKTEVWEPGIFYAFTVTALHKVMNHQKAINPEEVAKLITNGVTPVVEFDNPEDVKKIHDVVNSDTFKRDVLEHLDMDTVQMTIVGDEDDGNESDWCEWQ
jgi:hypothetical protein